MSALVDTSLNGSSNIRGHWKYDEASGTTLTDSYGANNLTVNSGMVGNAGIWGNALTSDGTNYAYKTGPTSALNPSYSQDFAWSFWINAPNTSGSDWNFIRNWNTSGNDAGYIWRLDGGSGGGGALFWGWNGGVGVNRAAGINFSGTFLDNTWHHVVIQGTGIGPGQTVYTYVDTVSATTSLTGGSNMAYGGSQQFRTNSFITSGGKTDDLVFFNRQLTTGEIAELAATPPSNVFIPKVMMF